MPQTDFTKAFPRSLSISEIHADGCRRYIGYGDGDSANLKWAPIWREPCVRDYMQGAYNDQIEADGWETVYSSAPYFSESPRFDKHGKRIRSLTKDPTDWETVYTSGSIHKSEHGFDKSIADLPDLTKDPTDWEVDR